MTGELLTVRQAAELLGIGYSGADQLIRRRRLQVVAHVGPVRQVRRSDVELLLTLRNPPSRKA